MQLEAVGRVSMGDLGLEIGGQVDDVDGVEGAFLWADTASDAEALRNEGDLGGRVDFDTQFARADDWARLFAFLSAFLRRVRIGKAQRGDILALGLHCHGEDARVSRGSIFVCGGVVGYLVRVDNGNTGLC